jgi:hypothetical protein
MTLADRIIPYQFWFEYGIGKVGVYFAIISIGLSITTLLTVKGMFFPLWGFIPLGIVLVVFCMMFGYFLDTRNIMGRLNSHMNRKGNPEFIEILDTLHRLEEKVDAMEKK